MKRFAITFLLIVVFVVIIAQPAIINAFLALLFLGMIPGTNIQIPFWIMLTILLLGGFLLIRWLSSQPLYIGGIDKQDQTARQIARKKVAKKVRASTTITTRKTRKKTKRSVVKRASRRLA